MNNLVYEFIDHEGNPFYVGKTNNIKRRMNEHKKDTKNGVKYYLYNKIRKLEREYNYTLTFNIIQDNLSEYDANSLEIKTIKEYREKGYKLTNITDGGEGTTGHKPVFTDKWKENLCKSAQERVKRDGVPFKGKKHSEATKKKMRENHSDMSGEKNPFYGKKHTQEVIERSRQRAKNMFSGVKKSDDHKKKIGLANSGENNYKVKLIKVTTPDLESFIWEKGTYKLSDFIEKKYETKITASAIQGSAKRKRPTRNKWTFEYLTK